MANISKIKAQGNIYDIEDTVARTSVVAVTSKADGTVELTSRNSTVTLPSLTNFGDPSELENDVVTEISDLKREIDQSTGMSAEFKVALENLVNQLVYKGDDPTGRTYINAIHTAMYPPASLTSITAVYTQSGTVYNTDSLDSLKSDLVVTAHMSDGTTEIVSTYALSGTLTVGTSTITVSYGGKNTTFSVTVAEEEPFIYGLANVSTSITGSYITDTGTIESATSDSGYYEEYVDVHQLSSFLTHIANASKQSGNYNWRISIYDANKNFTRQLHPMTSSPYETVTLNSGEKYVRFGWYSTTVPNFYIESTSPESLVMEIGDIDSTTGEDKTETRRIRSADYIPVSEAITVQDCPFAPTWAEWANTNNGYFFRCYDSSKNFVGTLIGSAMYRDDISDVALPTNTAFVRIVMQKNANSFSTGFTSGEHPFAIDGVSYLPVEA